MTNTLKLEHFAYLKNRSMELYSEKLAVLAQAQEELNFIDESEVQNFVESVISGEFVLGDTGKFYINMKQPVNVVNGTHEEEFLQLETKRSINPNTKVKEVDVDISFEGFANATLFDEESIRELPNSMKIYASEEFRLPEIEAVKIYGDFDKWLSLNVPELSDVEPIEEENGGFQGEVEASSNENAEVPPHDENYNRHRENQKTVASALYSVPQPSVDAGKRKKRDVSVRVK